MVMVACGLIFRSLSPTHPTHGLRQVMVPIHECGVSLGCSFAVAACVVAGAAALRVVAAAVVSSTSNFQHSSITNFAGVKAIGGLLSSARESGQAPTCLACRRQRQNLLSLSEKFHQRRSKKWHTSPRAVILVCAVMLHHMFPDFFAETNEMHASLCVRNTRSNTRTTAHSFWKAKVLMYRFLLKQQ